MGPIEHRHVPDAMNERAGCALCQLGEEGVAGLPVTPTTRSFDLDQLVVLQSARCLGCHCIGQASVPEADNGLELVCQASKVAALLLRKFGCRRRPDRW